MVTFHLFSDLHLEFGKPFTPPQPHGRGKQVALLAGNLGHPNNLHYTQLLFDFKKNFDHVIAIAGNHEYHAEENGHHVRIDDVMAACRKSAREAGTIFLERQAITLDLDEPVTILGTTFWSDLKRGEFSVAEQELPDFRMIYHGGGSFLTPAEYTCWYNRDIKWLREEITSRRKDHLVIMTHHPPPIMVSQPFYEDYPLAPTDLEELFAPQVRLWACGHSHQRGYAPIGYGWCGLNPRGYSGGNLSYPSMAFELFASGRIKLIV